MKKILVDLDVVTVAKWDKGKRGDQAREFLAKVEKGEFEMHTPYLVFDLVDKWKYEKLKNDIRKFYELHSSRLISATNELDQVEEKNINVKKVTKGLLEYAIKEEDVTLILVTSMFDIDYLVTFNRMHLKGKENEINEVLNENGLRTLKLNCQTSFSSCLFKLVQISEEFLSHTGLYLVGELNQIHVLGNSFSILGNLVHFSHDYRMKKGILNSFGLSNLRYANLNSLSDSLQNLRDCLALSITTGDIRHSGYINSVFILFNQDSELHKTTDKLLFGRIFDFCLVLRQDKTKSPENRKLYIEDNTKYVIESIIISVTSCVAMHVGKPERKFVVRIIDLRSNRSRNFSIYDGDGNITLDKVHDEIMRYAERSLGGKK